LLAILPKNVLILKWSEKVKKRNLIEFEPNFVEKAYFAKKEPKIHQIHIQFKKSYFPVPKGFDFLKLYVFAE